jgi:hypothetical protein
LAAFELCAGDARVVLMTLSYKSMIKFVER